MKALVTGCNGHLGTALTELLVSKGHEVRGSMRGIGDEKKTAPLRKLGVELVEADVLDGAALERACEGQEVVFHLAAVFRFVVDDPQKDSDRPRREGR
ncbi:MAG: NAD-dependent epimerase/dehydratase family protein [Archangium sp.]